MKAIHFENSLGSENVDSENAVIYGVSVLSEGTARGHDLEVDGTTLRQMEAAGNAKGQVPVKVDHKSGAAAVCGYLANFRVVARKLLADWSLLVNHPQTAQILEIAQRMPSGAGLSAAFMQPDVLTEPGKARIAELLSVDFVASPAANPSGLFAAKVGESGLSRGWLLGFLSHRNSPVAVRFERRPQVAAIRRVESAVSRNLPEGDLPGREVAQVAKRNPRAVGRLAKIVAGGGVGAFVGSKIAGRRGATAGLVGGAGLGAIAFEQSKNTMSPTLRENIATLIDQFMPGAPENKSESHTAESLTVRLCAAPDEIEFATAQKILRSLGPTHRGLAQSPDGYESNHLNDARHAICFAAVEDKLAELRPVDDNAALDVARSVVADRVRRFSRRDDEQEDSATGKLAKGAALAGGALIGANLLRGRVLAGPGKPLGALWRIGADANARTARNAAGTVGKAFLKAGVALRGMRSGVPPLKG